MSYLHEEVDSYRLICESGTNWDELITFNIIVYLID